MVISKTKLLAVFLLLFGSIYAQNPDTDTLFTKLIAKYNTIKTFKAHFEQHNYWYEPDIKKESAGEIFYNQTDLILRYSEPDGQILHADSTKIVLLDKNSGQALLSNKEGFDLKFIDYIKKYRNNSNITVKTVSDTTKVFLKTDDEQNISIFIKDMLIVYLSIEDVDKNIVSYNFSDIKTNVQLPVKIFSIEISEDINVIDTRNE